MTVYVNEIELYPVYELLVDPPPFSVPALEITPELLAEYNDAIARFKSVQQKIDGLCEGSGPGWVEAELNAVEVQ